MEFFQINIVVGIVGFDKCNARSIASLKFTRNIFVKL